MACFMYNLFSVWFLCIIYFVKKKKKEKKILMRMCDSAARTMAVQEISPASRDELVVYYSLRGLRIRGYL